MMIGTEHCKLIKNVVFDNIDNQTSKQYENEREFEAASFLAICIHTYT